MIHDDAPLDWTLPKRLIDYLRTQRDGNRALIAAAGGDSMKLVLAAQRLGKSQKPSKKIPDIEAALDLRPHSIMFLAEGRLQAFYSLGNGPDVETLIAGWTGVEPNVTRSRDSRYS